MHYNPANEDNAEVSIVLPCVDASYIIVGTVKLEVDETSVEDKDLRRRQDLAMKYLRG